VLWHDYFKAEHFEKYPNLHMLINTTIKQASGTGAKQKIDPAEGQKLLDGIDEIAADLLGDQGQDVREARGLAVPRPRGRSRARGRPPA
jgi:hypothetical protein